MRTPEGVPYANDTTSRLAAESMARPAPILRERVFVAIADAGEGGYTTDELEALLGLAHQTCSPRVNELARRGRIRANGTRKTRRGRAAIVWVAVKPPGEGP
jgi:hypothetical protein